MREGTQHVLEAFKNNPGKYSPDNIEDLDMKFEELADGIELCDNCRYDVKFKEALRDQFPILEEFKSYNKDTWSGIATSDKFLNQFKAYLGSGEIQKIEDLAYVINTRKSMAGDVRNAFKGLFEGPHKDDIFLSMNSTLKQNLGLLGPNSKSKFDLLISDLNSQLYTFIKP